ncbi:hypothetical protein DFH05DRAFT_1484981 [Lentinula detonsa]|uniref:Carbohydrate-binding module family 50 protein n=1 Tax=Lentinula detonsa TaxID=2804962 RepID=A0A9W8TZM3_9AGAR|nr:hypothetical protein DFH05DRAFT_1484981 [Lentinula detonsa]
MSRFTQYAEDASRLPEGFQRIAYDADTQRYTFKDRKGALYQSAPGESYGKLSPLSDGTRADAWRYDDEHTGNKRPQISTSPNLSFHDILPPHAIVSAGSSESPTSSNSDSEYPSLSSLSPRAKFIEAARRSTMPKMQGVVNGLRRSVTLVKKQSGIPPTVPEKDEKVALLRSQSVMSNMTGKTSRSSVMTLVALVDEKRA